MEATEEAAARPSPAGRHHAPTTDAAPTVTPHCGGRSACPDRPAAFGRCGSTCSPTRRTTTNYEVFLVRVAPPRPRSVTPVSLRTRCTNPYDRPVDSARARMLAPFSYFFFRSAASLSRWAAGDPCTLLQVGHDEWTSSIARLGPLRGRPSRTPRDAGAGPPRRGTMIVDSRTHGHQCVCGSANGWSERITQSGDQWNLGGPEASWRARDGPPALVTPAGRAPGSRPTSGPRCRRAARSPCPATAPPPPPGRG